MSKLTDNWDTIKNTPVEECVYLAYKVADEASDYISELLDEDKTDSITFDYGHVKQLENLQFNLMLITGLLRKAGYGK